MRAVVMAGGLGTRLGAISSALPKPLVPLGGYPILEIIARKLRAGGFDRLTLCVSHLGAMIEHEFGDGSHLGMAVDYVWDLEPMGTAGPLRCVPDLDSPTLVMNADVLTGLDFGAFAEAHRKAGGVMTIAACRRSVPVDFGVLRIADDGRLLALDEKPELVMGMAAGIYMIEPSVVDHLPETRRVDMPDLVTALLDRGLDVRAHQFGDPWHDVGTPSGLQIAERDFLSDPDAFLGGPVDEEMPDDAAAPGA